MQEEYNQFIGIYRNVFNKSFCDSLIEFFNEYQENNVTHGEVGIKDNHVDPSNTVVWDSDDQYGGPLYRRDYDLNLDAIKNQNWYNKINDKIFDCLELYKGKYFGLMQNELNDYTIPYVKMQKTYPQGGYHIWHSEVGSISDVSRVMAWILYLNDIPEGEGETEFLFQGLRMQPEYGTLVIWPAHFTHVHRGNPVYTKEKYITTGWIEYAKIIDNHPNSPVIYDDSNHESRYKDDECRQDDNDHVRLEETFNKKEKPYKRLSDLI